MLQITCPRCGNLHHADEAYAGRMLRCAKCGDAVQIACPASNSTSIKSANGVDKETPVQKRAIKRTKASLVVAVIAMVCISLVFISRSINQGSEEAYRKQIQSDPKSIPSVPTPLQAGEFEGVQESSTELRRILPSGTRLRRDVGVNGHGVLTVDNFSHGDAVVKLLNSASKHVVRFVYVQKGAKVDLHGLEEGNYRVRFTFGEDWNDKEKLFSRDQSYYEFGKVLSFQETRQSDGLLYSHQEITLNTALDGNVERLSISKEDFAEE